MDLATAATKMRTLHVLPSSANQKAPNSATTLTQKPVWPSSKSEVLSLNTCRSTFTLKLTSQPKGPKSKTRNQSLSFTRCSTKPDVGSDNVKKKKKNTAIELDSTSTPHQKLATAPPNQTLPSTFSRGLVLDLGPKNSWDGAETGSPVVKRYIGDDEERWYMWYHGRSDQTNGSDLIGLAVSSNGIHWSRGVGPVRSCGDVGAVMNCRTNWWAFDTHSIRPSELVLMSSTMYSAVYWLYYTGYTSEEVEISSEAIKKNPLLNYQIGERNGNIFKSLPGLACSQDGRHWARIEGDHHSGALLDVGSSGEWDSLYIAAPKVIMHSDDDLRMYYHSFDAENGHFAVGLARSRDGIRWIKMAKIMGGRSEKGSFDEFGVLNASVVRNKKGGNYLMAFEGVDENGVRRIGLAVSDDGLKEWRRLGDAAILEPSNEDGWDNKGVTTPCLVQTEGHADEWRLYYRGIGEGGKTGIGLAVSEGSDIRRFRRWSGFQL